MPRSPATPAPRVALRPETPADEPVVRRAHVAHRAALFAALPLPPDAMARLCDQQHDLQERHIAEHEAGAERSMIVVRGKAVGRLVLGRGERAWRVIDIALLPEAQGRGVGSAVLGRVLRDAAAAGAAVELHVGRDNPRAEALYRRLGFVDAITASASHRRLVRPDPS